MQTEEQSQFRFTPQVAVVLLVTGFALMVPLALVIVAARDLLFPPAKEAPAVVAEQVAPLQEALEKAAGENLAPQTLSSGDRSVLREVADVARERERIEKLARAEGAVPLPSNPGDQDSVSLLVQLPANRADAFIKMCQGLLPEEAADSTKDKDARVLVEVVIRRKSP